MYGQVVHPACTPCIPLYSADSFFALYEEAVEICCTKRQSVRKTTQEQTYTEDELSDEDEYLCECSEQ